MALLVIFLLLVGYEVSGNPIEVNNDLLNDVDSPEVQGYEVHEKLADRKVEEGRPHDETTGVYSSTNQASGGESTVSKEKTSVADSVGVHETAGEAVRSGNYAAGKEVVRIINHKTNSHATPYNSVLSDSIKHTVGEDATFTHKPIIVRDLTLSELDNGSYNNRALNEERYNRKKVSPGVLTVSEESLSVNTPEPSKAQSSIDSDRIKYKHIGQQPHHSSNGSPVETRLHEHRGFPHSNIDEDGAVVQTTVSPKVLINQNPVSEEEDETPEGDVQRGNQEGYSRNDENEDVLNSKTVLPTPTLPLGTQNYFDHPENGNRINLFPFQPPYVLHQNVFGRYPPAAGEYSFNQNEFSNPYSPPQFDPERYNTRSPYNIPHQPTLHHVEHAFHSPPHDENSPIGERDEALLGREISNHNLYFPPYPDNGGLAFRGVPFIRPPPSMFPYPREEANFGIPEDFINGSAS